MLPQRLKEHDIRKAAYLRDVPLKKQHAILAVRWWRRGGAHRSKSGAGSRVGAQKECWAFPAHAQNCREWCWTQGLDADSLSHWAHPGEQSPQDFRAHGQINSYTNSPCHTDMILTEKIYSVPKPEERAAGDTQKRMINWKLRPGNNAQKLITK